MASAGLKSLKCAHNLLVLSHSLNVLYHTQKICTTTVQLHQWSFLCGNLLEACLM